MSRPTKRERLVQAAAGLSHQRGLSNATLATIADHADVPVGNIYYYFKTKDEIASAVVRARSEEYEVLRRAWNDSSLDPVQRLLEFVHHARDQADELAALGCPIGGLCDDLARTSHELAAEAGDIFRATIAWAADNYAAAGHHGPVEAATRLVASVQGATVLAHALGDPDVLRQGCAHVEQELRALR